MEEETKVGSPKSNEKDEKNEPKAKKHRKRKKRLKTEILKQFEFYFSDANLRKDKFLQNVINNSTDCFVPITIFLTFNRIKEMTDDISLIKQAISKSTFLELNEDKSGIRRKDGLTPSTLPPPEKLDNRTVYVEFLPEHADINWMHKLFSEAGKVLFVSLPRYPTTGDLKGFGFVEFESVEEAEKACQTFNNPPAHAYGKGGKFPKANKQMKQVASKVATLATTPDTESKKPENKNQGTKLKTSGNDKPKSVVGSKSTVKNKTKDVKEAINDPTRDLKGEPASKRARTRSPAPETMKSTEAKPTVQNVNKTESTTSILKSKENQTNKKKHSLDKCDESKEESIKRVRISDQVEIKEQPHIKAKRQRRRRNSSEKESRHDLPEIRVIPKLEWLELRKDYMAIQKNNFKNLKQKLTHINKQKEAAKASEEKKTEEKKSVKAKDKEIEFTPNVIVHITTKNASNRKQIKEQLSGHGDIVYIDFLEGGMNGHLRCKDSESAQKLSDCHLPGIQLSLLEGEAEKNYWDKLKADRHNKLNNSKKIKKRGFQKIIQRAEKVSAVKKVGQHIIFD